MIHSSCPVSSSRSSISFHILFPAFTIGLATWIVRVWKALWLRDRPGRSTSDAFRFWTKIFAVSFGMGVVSGIVMRYQFGTNWSRFSDPTGNVLGPLIAYEVLTAFFLEAAFLGIMLFGCDRVPRGVHFFATCMVALGTLISAFWILAANSWMQTPAGYRDRATAGSCPTTGGRSSSTRPSPTASCTW